MLASAPNFLRQATTHFRLVLLLGAMLGAFGCKPKIGEDCAISTDCSLSGDRLCDITQPGGYCTVFNCEPGQCPDEAACVAFSEGTCSTSSVSTRLRRTFCMKTCDEDNDCRGGGYRCLDTTNDPGRTVVDVNPPKRRICAVPTPPSADNAGPPQRDPATCFPSDASFDTSRPEAGPVPPDSREASTGDTARDNDVASADRTDASDSTPVETGADTTIDTTSDDAREDGAGEDVTPDTGEDVTPDTGEDAALDASDDVTADAGEDATPDAGQDATPDANDASVD